MNAIGRECDRRHEPITATIACVRVIPRSPHESRSRLYRAYFAPMTLR